LVIEPLDTHHDRRTFDCGISKMNAFLRQTARQHATKHIGVTHVAVEDVGATRILGFSLTHLSGAGASGDIPFMPITALNRARPPSRTLYYPFPEPLDEI